MLKRHGGAGIERGIALLRPRHSVLLYSIAIAILLLTAPFSRASAHDPGLSTLDIRPTSDRITADLTLARTDIANLCALDTDGDGSVSRSELEAAMPLLKPIAARSLEIEQDGQMLEQAEVFVDLSEGDAIRFRLVFSRPVGRLLHVTSTLLKRLPLGHRQFLTLHDQAGRMVRNSMLDAGNGTWETDLQELAPPQATSTFGRFLLLGIEHILTGYDHLLFLVALLL
ncbi:MAG: hypothetical protein ABI882_06945, partial [Acidobacteriota bacterium]